jgi:hypothetical protein
VSKIKEAALSGRKKWVEGQKDLLDWMFARRSSPPRRSANHQPHAAAPIHAGLRESLAAVPPCSTLLVGHYAEMIDGFPAERRSFLPSSWQKWSGDLAALLPRIPLPQAVVGAGADADKMTAADFAAFLASQKLHHLDECLETLPDEGPAGRRYRLRYQADVLRVSGFAAVEVDRALRCALSELHTQEYDAAVCRGDIVLRPSLWPEWWRRTWPVWKQHGVRGALRLVLARLKSNSAHNGASAKA